MSAYRHWVLLDRDGTLIKEAQYLSRPEQVELLPGASEGLRALRSAGCGLVVLTNQSGVARGYFTRDDITKIHARLDELLAAEGVTLDGYYVCPHGNDDNCACRKPRAGMAEQAATERGIDLARSFMIGDKRLDLQMGRAVGAATVLVRTGYGAEVEAADGDLATLADVVVDNLAAAARWIVPQLAERETSA